MHSTLRLSSQVSAESWTKAIPFPSKFATSLARPVTVPLWRPDSVDRLARSTSLTSRSAASGRVLINTFAFFSFSPAAVNPKISNTTLSPSTCSGMSQHCVTLSSISSVDVGSSDTVAMPAALYSPGISRGGRARWVSIPEYTLRCSFILRMPSHSTRLVTPVTRASLVTSGISIYPQHPLMPGGASVVACRPLCRRLLISPLASDPILSQRAMSDSNNKG